ncbi:oxidoreductase [Robbsia sp. KACC 23696]|uniref:oxidoreductase n=1 Tax=Robbsia sp. KACC 23696 TaxID=3149231 RepID=UPI00325BBB3B
MASPMRTWLITGCSTGLGRSLAEVLIEKGEQVIATARNPASLSDLVAGHGNAHALKLDVTSASDIADVLAYADRELGGIDVLVNNAGYGYIASVEEAEETEYRALFETNLFGLIEVTRAVLPGLRAKGAGHILNISSVGGMMGNIGSAYYAGTKFALVGFSEALSKEVAELGIKVTVVAPGPFRTDWAGRSLKTAPKRIDAYADTVHRRIDGMEKTSGAQAGDPVRAAEAMIAAVDSPKPPLHLILGESGLTRVREHLVALQAEIDDWAEVSISADFPK